MTSSDGEVSFLDLGSVYIGGENVLETYVIDADDGLAALLVQAGSLTLNSNLHTFVHSPSTPRDSVISERVHMRVRLKAKLICDVADIENRPS